MITGLHNIMLKNNIINRLVIVLPAFIAASTIIDYSLTMWLSGTTENLIRHELSPLLILAVKNNLTIPYILSTAIFYFSCSYFALKALSSDEKLFYSSSAIIFLISLVHTLGGLSWHFKSEAYSNTLLALSAITIIMAIFLSGWSILHRRNPG